MAPVAFTPQPEWMESLKAVEGVELSQGEPMGEHVTMGVGGPACLWVMVHQPEALPRVMQYIQACGAPWFLLGGGSNTIFAQAGFEGIVLSLGRGFREMTLGPEPHQVTAGAAAGLSAVMNFAKRAGLSGLEWAAGVPGTLGGALAGNAGTPTGDICSLADRVQVLSPQGEIFWRERGTFDYGYRTSQLREGVIVQAVLGLEPAPPDQIARRIEAALAKRATQPVGVRCSGCAFKNPAGDYAGRLIDQCGLKGMRVGGATVSPQHANFILNEGQATAADIEQLIRHIRQTVKERTGVELELEIRMVGLDSTPQIK